MVALKLTPNNEFNFFPQINTHTHTRKQESKKSFTKQTLRKIGRHGLTLIGRSANSPHSKRLTFQEDLPQANRRRFN